jgi:hypothetical protein
MNIFQLDYETRLLNWSDLRNQIKNQSLEDQCVAIDKFWQQVPIQNHYLHPDFVDQWPGPWDLIYENLYCPYARALGMIYTLLFTGTKNVELVEATDDNAVDVVLVLVNDAKYILNYWPDMVLNISLQNFTVKSKIDISEIIKTIGKL